MIHFITTRSTALLISLILLGSPKMLYGSPLSTIIEKTYTPQATYVSPSQEDLEKAKKLFYTLFSSKNFKIDDAAWNSLGFESEKIGSFLIIKEKESNQTGKGVYIFNTLKPSQIIIEAPHRPSDLHTGTIAVQLMEKGWFLATALNTVHRKKANFTREVMTYFNAFTEAFGEAYPQGNIIQLHGFDGEKHDLSTDLIFSATLLSPPPLFYHYGECLKKLPLKISLFPKDIETLGGTKNINALKFYKTHNEGLFLHLEMDINLRKKLKNNKLFREKFFKCFLEK